MTLPAAHQDLWELSIDMVATASPDGYLTRVSPSWQQTLGYSPEELMARPYLDFVHPDDVQRTLHEAEALLDPAHLTVSFENRYRTKDGSYRWLAWSARTSADRTSIYCVVRDVTGAREAAREREELVARLTERDLMLTSVIANNMALTYVKDLDGRYLMYNQAFADAFSLDARAAQEDMSGLEVLLGRDDMWLDPALAPVWRRNDLRAARGRHFVEEWSEHPQNGRRTYDSSKFPLLNAAGEVYATCGISLETTERVRLMDEHKRAEELFTGAFEHSPIGKALIRPDHRVMRANDALCRITGYPVEQLVGKTLQEMTAPQDADEDLDSIARLTAGEISTHQQELRLFNASGHVVWVLASWSVVRDDYGGLVYLIAQIQDISERKLLEERLRRVADHDSLTGVRNRRLFEEDLLTQVGRCQRYGEQAALLMIDLDDFKQINDRHGHRAGDDMLKAVAAVLKQRLRSTDEVARLGGDEFGILLAHVGRSQAEAVAADVKERIAQATIKVDGADVTLRGSVGLAFIDEDSHDAEAVMADADASMYAAKNATRAATS